jgi:hypothetical protein
VKIAWPRGDLEVTCASEKLLRQRFAEGAAAVKLVLTVLHQSDNLREVRNFRSIQLFLVHPAAKRDGGLLIRHKEIDVTATLLNDDNTTVYEATSKSTDWLNPIRRLRILTISNNS